jgi:hypothetical protein
MRQSEDFASNPVMARDTEALKNLQFFEIGKKL